MKKRMCALALGLGFAFAQGQAQAQPATASEKVPVVASFSILADMVRQVGGERVEVTALVGEDSDAHVYEPKPADVARIGKAKVMVVNGLGFESWADRLIKAAKFQGEKVIATNGVTPIKTRGAIDPHAWQDPANVKFYAANIRDGLSKADPAGAEKYRAGAAAFIAAAEAASTAARAQWDAIPKERRRVITSHDAFGYYGRAFGVALLAPQGVGTETEPSARDVARLIRQIKAQKARAIFIENISNRKMIERIAAETGAKIGGTLYSDALGGPADTWLAMLQHNTKLLTEALK